MYTSDSEFCSVVNLMAVDFVEVFLLIFRTTWYHIKGDLNFGFAWSLPSVTSFGKDRHTFMKSSEK
jgi:hypothetical protein